MYISAPNLFRELGPAVFSNYVLKMLRFGTISKYTFCPTYTRFLSVHIFMAAK